MHFAPIHARLQFVVEGEGHQKTGDALALMYAEADPGFPASPSLYYLVSFPDEPRPRLVPQDAVVEQRVS